MVEIRFAREEDFPRLAELERLCFSTPWSELSFADFARHGGMILTAVENGGISGYVTLLFAADEGEIANLATDPGARRKGIASRLLTAAEEQAVSRGGKALFLEVRASNQKAISLYEKNGYQAVGRRKNFYQFPTEDALLYRKDLV
ncbi:MAG: ribosomal protein S18-alanine N-acetyltransferase [Clostridia bacterium]|nr:ribosomal protein S18-alanine N-acetyltransferase [Clostridia bacterium]